MEYISQNLVVGYPEVRLHRKTFKNAQIFLNQKVAFFNYVFFSVFSIFFNFKWCRNFFSNFFQNQSCSSWNSTQESVFCIEKIRFYKKLEIFFPKNPEKCNKKSSFHDFNPSRSIYDPESMILAGRVMGAERPSLF